ncbi:MlaE family ABC transporter permease [Sorlinia euscelidii]|uniref:ABC transporter permease n=1 Tax=Sorlinia euscelidii TaxID=3081148 RepID=A0ABU7U3Q1_9PROT
MTEVNLLLLHRLATIGRLTRRILRATLITLSAAWGVVIEALSVGNWRRTVRLEFRSTLVQATGGGLISTLVTGALVGFALVAQTIYWLGIAGMADAANALIITILVREVAPVLVSIILLGRSGMLSLAQLGQLTLGREMRVLRGMGIDPFLMFVMPRVLAMTVSAFTLGVVFSVMSLVSGYAVCRFESVISVPLWTFLYEVTGAMQPIDYLAIPLKFLVSGFSLSLSTCLTALDVRHDDDFSTLLPKGFMSGMLAILVVNVALGIIFG